MAAPTISALADVALLLNEALTATAFTVGDDVTAVGDLTVTAVSSNQAVVADGDITLGGADAARTIALTPVADAEGTATITVTVDDGTATTDETFVVTFSGVPAGDVLPVLVRRVWSTGTTATNMVAVW